LERANGLLLRSVRGGLLFPAWKVFFTAASVDPSSEALGPFLKEYDGLEQRLRETF